MTSRHPTTAAFLGQLARFRRRLVVVAFVRLVPAVAALAILATVIAVSTMHATSAHGAIWFAAFAALVLAVAGGVALQQKTSLSVTATVLDRRFRLDDLAMTAWQFAADSDPISQLIVADAGARLAKHAPEEIQFEPPAQLGWIATGAAALLLALAATFGKPSAPPSVEASRRQVTANASQVAGRLSEPSRSTTASTGAETKSERATADSPHAANESTAPARGESPPRDQVRSGLPASAERPNASEGKDPAVSTTAADTHRGDSSESRRGSASASKLETSAGRQAGGDEGGHDGSAGPGGGQTLGPGTGAGGVKGAVPLSGARAPARVPADDSQYAARFRRAWNQEESPVAQERTPSGLRKYIRAYFLAIRPSGS